MILGIRDVYYYVQDMDRAIRFYRDLLGFRVLDQSDHWTSLEVGGLRFGLHWTGGDPVPTLPRDAHGALCGGTLTLQVDDLEAEVLRLRSAGIKFLGQPSYNSWGNLAALEDPDGNVLKLMELPKS